MSRQRLNRPLTLLLACAALATPVAFAAVQASPEAIAVTVVDNLQANRFDAIAVGFTPQMAKLLPAPELAARWRALTADVGALQGSGQPTLTQHGKDSLLVMPLHFVHGDFNLVINIDGDQRIAGLMLQGIAPPAAPVPADAPYSEQAMEVAGLGGTLARPRGPGPFPAVLLVHGSGPQDQDETIGASRPFLDVARCLAAQGIAVLRYEKRTYAQPQAFADGDFGVEAETVNDAVIALEKLTTTPGIDPHHLYVMGHSQGGQLAPRIAAQSGKAAGVILWAAPSRRLLDLLPDQNRFLLTLDGSLSNQDKAQLAQLDQQIVAIRAGKAPNPPLPGAPASYWRDADRVDAIADLSALKLPVLWLQGGRDFQVTAPDWSGWKQALATRTDATEHFYPAFNHLGIAGSGPANPAEYQQPGHVDPQLINDVARWIKQLQ